MAGVTSGVASGNISVMKSEAAWRNVKWPIVYRNKRRIVAPAAAAENINCGGNIGNGVMAAYRQQQYGINQYQRWQWRKLSEKRISGGGSQSKRIKRQMRKQRKKLKSISNEIEIEAALREGNEGGWRRAEINEIEENNKEINDAANKARSGEMKGIESVSKKINEIMAAYRRRHHVYQPAGSNK